LRLALLVVVVAACLAGLGYVPTKRLAGDAGLAGMVAGCAASVLASLGAGLVAVQGVGADAAGRLKIVLASMLVRFGLALVLALAMVLSGYFERTPLLIWLAISYMALLVIDTWFLLGTGDTAK
jgi:hypothetical protein